MVETDIAKRGVHSPRVLEVMRETPRHLFVSPDQERHAYEDHPLQIGHGQTISQPYMVAVMTELLDLRPEDCVLEIGTGSGYQTAILASLAREVVSIERQPELAEDAADRLHGLGYTNVLVHCGDGTLGWPEGAPYDAILVTAGSPGVPHALKEQLAMGGRLVCPAGSRDVQQLVKIVRTETGFVETTGISCIFVPLIGQQGWPDGAD
ncbi:MAG TPA: protein-L-isoaspartate(D-aspartate) O-methyltransferase [Candidatus Hydrogenedentes bacterium]|nr:protein-L-isoaspartate(D-aspartate) O-methyltransferase [Candidatus Hydrogenedentota bacterium]